MIRYDIYSDNNIDIHMQQIHHAVMLNVIGAFVCPSWVLKNIRAEGDEKREAADSDFTVNNSWW